MTPALPALRRSCRAVAVAFGSGLLLALGGCGEGTVPAEPPTAEAVPTPAAPAPVGAPAPPTGGTGPAPRADPAGLYVFSGTVASGRLELQDGGAFLFISFARQGGQQRLAKGRWTLGGKDLVLVYEEVDGKPVEPERTVSRWEGDRIVMSSPGGEFVLEKRTVLRIR
jgi:hypothetical protein